jgi:hypothetical protein
VSAPPPDLPGLDPFLGLVRRVPAGADVSIVADPELARFLPAARAVDSPDELRACDAVACRAPSRFGPPLAIAQALRARARMAFLADLVWATAPSPDLARAFATGRADKVRPMEGFEMQVEQAGWRIVAREHVARDAWLAHLRAGDPRRGVVEADARQAARVLMLALEREG